MSKILLLLSIILSVFVSGCMEQTTDFSLPKQPSTHQVLNTSASSMKSSAGALNEYEITEPNGVLTLRQALTLTLIKNPVLKAYSLETRAADARALQAGLRPNPELGVEVENVGGSGALSGFDSAETTIAISQLIEFGKKAEKRRKVASLEKELSEWDYETRRIEVLTDAGKAFIELLAVQERTGLLAELTNVSKEALNSVSQRVEAGKDSPLEKTKASVALSNVQIEYKQALKELEQAKKILASFWGNERPLFTQAQGQLAMVSDIPERQVLKQKLMSNPQLARWETEIARNKATAELAKSKSVPDISIGGGVRRFNETDENAFVFGISIPLPISDRNQGGRMEAAANLSKSYEEKRAARIEVTNQFDQMYTKLSTSLDKIRELQAAVLPGAKEVFEASQEAYNQGKIDYLNVLDAQRTYFVSQTEYLDALLSYHKAKADMEGLTGQTMNNESIQQ
jgi:cobalt-zinc-cadmium efflux system outer membrane protein